MKKEVGKKKKALKKKYKKPVVETKNITDSIVKVYGTYGPGNPVTVFGT